MRPRDLEQNRCLLVGNGCLSDQLIRERVTPGKVDSDLREPQLEELELAKVFVQ